MKILNEAGMAPAEQLAGGYTTWWLTTCLACGVQAHYRLEFILEKRGQGENPCRVCSEAAWSAQARESRFSHLPEDDPFRRFTETMEELLTQYTPEQISEAYPTEDVRGFLDAKCVQPRTGGNY